MDSSPPNTGFILVPRLGAVLIFVVIVIRTSLCWVMCIVLWSSFGGADDSGVHNR